MNQHTRREFLLMFLWGAGVWKTARAKAIAPVLVEKEVREELIQRGLLRDLLERKSA